MTIVFKVSEPTQKKMINYYDHKKREKNPPYSIFQADEADTIITLYQSGKVMFQGISADIDANMWKEIEKKSGHLIEDQQKKESKEKTTSHPFIYETTIGSDEVGTGDYFGPIVVTASYVPKSKIAELKELGVTDSKKLNDEKIMEIGPKLIASVEHCTFILDNMNYNKYQPLGYNMNQMKAILHNKVLLEMKHKNKTYNQIVVDQFEPPKSYFNHLIKAKEVVRDITFITKAESICSSVAVSSCISRYIFLKKMNELSIALGMTLQKGAGELVDNQALTIIKKYGFSKLTEIAKLNFKNTEKIKSHLN